VRGRGSQPELREEQAGPSGVTDRLVLLMKPGNAGGGKEPDFWRVPGRDQESGDWLCLSTPLRLSGHEKNFTCQRRWRCWRGHARCETKPSCAGAREASRRAVCGKFARTARKAAPEDSLATHEANSSLAAAFCDRQHNRRVLYAACGAANTAITLIRHVGRRSV